MAEKLAVLELFSGIGGMHAALTAAMEEVDVKVEVEVVAAMDINTTSNAVYQHNHPGTKVLNRNIGGLTAREVGKMAPRVVLMSPPCQPHTRQGKRLDTEDPRSSPLSHLATLLPAVPSITAVLLENVAGFETSQARQEVVAGLEGGGFECREFLLCPRLLGRPNSRLRYYLLARREAGWGREGLHRDLALLQGARVKEECVGDYLEEGREEDLVEEKVLEKRSLVLDIVTEASSHSCCFTAGYTRYSEGTGSVVHQRGDREGVYARAAGLQGAEKVEVLKELGLRYFSPQEVARLLGFPPTFTFPPSVGRRQQYKCLGNSLSVSVVSLLIRHLLAPTSQPVL